MLAQLSELEPGDPHRPAAVELVTSNFDKFSDNGEVGRLAHAIRGWVYCLFAAISLRCFHNFTAHMWSSVYCKTQLRIDRIRSTVDVLLSPAVRTCPVAPFRPWCHRWAAAATVCAAPAYNQRGVLCRGSLAPSLDGASCAINSSIIVSYHPLYDDSRECHYYE